MGDVFHVSSGPITGGAASPPQSTSEGSKTQGHLEGGTVTATRPSRRFKVLNSIFGELPAGGKASKVSVVQQSSDYHQIEVMMQEVIKAIHQSKATNKEKIAFQNALKSAIEHQPSLNQATKDILNQELDHYLNNLPVETNEPNTAGATSLDLPDLPVETSTTHTGPPSALDHGKAESRTQGQTASIWSLAGDTLDLDPSENLLDQLNAIKFSNEQQVAYISVPDDSSEVNSAEHRFNQKALTYQKPKTIFGRFAHWLYRSKADQESYRQGMSSIFHTLVQNPNYGQQTARRFAEEFQYRYTYGKPLTVRALKQFLEEENALHKDTTDLAQLEQKALTTKKGRKTPLALEDFLKVLNQDTSSSEAILTYQSHQDTTQTSFARSRISILGCWFSQSRERKREVNSTYQEVKRLLTETLEKPLKRHPGKKEEIFQLFEKQFCRDEKPQEIQIKQFQAFLNKAIKKRNEVTTFLGRIHAAGEAVEHDFEGICQYVEDCWTSLGHAAAFAATANAVAHAQDPISAAVNGVVTGGIFAVEGTSQRLLTSALLIYGSHNDYSLFNRMGSSLMHSAVQAGTFMAALF